MAIKKLWLSAQVNLYGRNNPHREGAKMKKTKIKCRIEHLLWDYLMECLAIHHNKSFMTKFKTIPETKAYFADKIIKEMKE